MFLRTCCTYFVLLRSPNIVSLYIAAASWSDSSACEFESDSDVDSASPSRFRTGEERRLLGAGVDLNGWSRLGELIAACAAEGT